MGITFPRPIAPGPGPQPSAPFTFLRPPTQITFFAAAMYQNYFFTAPNYENYYLTALLVKNISYISVLSK